MIYCGDSDCRDLTDSVAALLTGLGWSDIRKINYTIPENGIKIQVPYDTALLADAIERGTNGRLIVNSTITKDIKFLQIIVGAKPN